MGRAAAKDWILERPALDQLAAVLVALGAAFLPGWLPSDGQTRTELFATLAGLCGLVLAAATFVCTLTYQSDGHVMKTVRARFGPVLASNWTSIIVASFTAAVVALAAIALDHLSVQAASAAAAYSVVAILTAFYRVVVWLRLTLFFEEVAEKRPEPRPVEFNPAKRASP